MAYLPLRAHWVMLLILMEGGHPHPMPRRTRVSRGWSGIYGDRVCKLQAAIYIVFYTSHMLSHHFKQKYSFVLIILKQYPDFTFVRFTITTQYTIILIIITRSCSCKVSLVIRFDRNLALVTSVIYVKKRDANVSL